MNRARDKFFSRAGLPKNANAGFADSDTIDLREQLFHSLAAADQCMFAETLTKLTVFIFEACQPQSIFDGDQQLIGGKRLFQESERAEPRGLPRHFDMGLAGNQ